MERMIGTLVHRGPDGSGAHISSGIGLGIRRLSIIDLETGDQPLACEDGSIVAVCNGEIYNAPELREELAGRGHRFRSRSDVEPVVHLFEESGPDCVDRLRGMFALAVWDGRNQRLMLARDRFGIKPLDYAITRDGLWFGSEAKAILASGAVGRDVDVLAIEDLFTWGFVRTPRTLFASIRRLPPAHVLIWKGGAPVLRRYWSAPDDAESTEMTAQEWAEALRAKLEETVRIHLRSDVEVGGWLSAGLDSSSVVSLARKVLGRPLRTFTLAFEDEKIDETRRARTLDTYPGHEHPNERALCDRASFELLPKMVWHMEEPSASNLEISRYLIARATARHVKVAVAGEGADEIFGGYSRYLQEKLLAPFMMLPAPVRRALLFFRTGERRHGYRTRLLLGPRYITTERFRLMLGPLGMPQRFRLWTPDLAHAVAGANDREAVEITDDELRGLSRFSQQRRAEVAIRLPDYVLHHVDRTSMACGLEARVPFLDHEFVELAAKIPPSLKLHHFTEKYILRRAMKGVLPEEIRRRRKFGLGAPSASWWRSSLPAFAREMLSESALRQKGYFDPGAVGDTLRRTQVAGARFGMLLNAVLVVQLWDELFIAGRSLDPPAQRSAGPDS